MVEAAATLGRRRAGVNVACGVAAWHSTWPRSPFKLGLMVHTTDPENLALKLRKRFGSALVQGFFEGASALGRLHPEARKELSELSIDRDVPYRHSEHPAHRLDVYRRGDLRDATPKSLPIILYVHGGGFRILSKDTHWILGLIFARFGYLVFNVNYRLAPNHPYPAALEDVGAAYSWVLDNGERYGGDVSRLIVAGESAGANLVTSLAIAATYARGEPWARDVYHSGVVPAAVLPACGMLQVSDPMRFRRRKPKISSFLNDRILEVSRAYLHGVDVDRPGVTDLADPLVFLERREKPSRPLPPFFISCGTADPILDDSRRLGRALDALGVDNEVRLYPGMPHAFHAVPLRKQAREQWQHNFAFLARRGLAGAALPGSRTGD